MTRAKWTGATSHDAFTCCADSLGILEAGRRLRGRLPREEDRRVAAAVTFRKTDVP